jgi:hypothetical protein
MSENKFGCVAFVIALGMFFTFVCVYTWLGGK